MNEVLLEVKKILNLEDKQIKEVLSMLEEGATIPFIARYRKERTGGLNEDEIRSIEEVYTYQKNLYDKKCDVIRLIKEKDLLTPELEQNILNAIIKCLDSEKVAKLKNRFIFIEYSDDVKEYEISEYTMKIENKFLEMTKIKMKDFSILYDELSKKKNKIPVKILRYYKDELYNFVLTNEPNNTIKVGSIEDERIKDEELVMAIGKVQEVAFDGLRGFSANEWYRDIIMNDKRFKTDDILTYVAPKLLKGSSNKLPLNKYLKESTKKYEELEKIALQNDFNNIISKSIKKR